MSYLGNVLIAEDEAKIRALLKEYLTTEGYSCYEAANGREAIDLFKQHQYVAVILDVMMPKMDGWSVCRTIRETSDVPVIMLTARGEEYDKLFGFELGVDDYIIKPFSPKELMARLKAIIRRNKTNKLDQKQPIFKAEGLVVDFDARNVYVNEVLVKLTPKEYDLLVYMVRNKNRALSRQQILDGVWGMDFFGDDRTVDTHIKMLRESLGAFKHFFVTVWSVGYKFEPKERE